MNHFSADLIARVMQENEPNEFACDDPKCPIAHWIWIDTCVRFAREIQSAIPSKFSEIEFLENCGLSEDEILVHLGEMPQ